ncbi:MAG TPA: glycosyltransferase family 4 protein [Candidatus Saccharimonadales bacterium]|nr:glycosyltransferase family 4 protein [Candidatus Saccharimonadales bacterium]
MKILHLTKKYPELIGGDAVVVKNLREYQIKNKNSIFILTSNNKTIIDAEYIFKFGIHVNDNELDDINIKRIISLFILFFYSFKLLKQIKPDVVHSHSIDMAFIISFACRFYNIPQVTTFHCGLFSQKNRFNLRGIIESLFLPLSGFKKIITVNNQDMYMNKNVFFIPNGVDPNKFKPTLRKNNIPIILYVGRIVEIKGLDYLVSAVNSINKKGYKVKLHIIGEGDYKKELDAKIEKLNIKNIKFIKKINHDELTKYYAQADVLVLPSVEQEGFGLVLIEALASGTPVVTTNVCGLANYIEKYNCGIVIPPKDSDKLTNALLEILKNKDLSNRFIKNGKKLIKAKFTWKEIVNEINNIYLTVLR